MDLKKVKSFFKKFWYILWKDNSFKGWLLSLIVIFVFIKFIFFPLLSLATGTQLPLAIVESCSMYHSGNVFSSFDAWWGRHDEKYAEQNISKSEFSKFMFRRGFSKGDILFIIGTKPEKVKIGDVIIFRGNLQNPVIHRVINITQEEGDYFFSTMGDNNNGQLSFEEKINEDDVMGKAVFRIIPYVGWAKLVFFEGQRIASEKGFCREN
ncbi:MAG: signal peptidase I [Candidatus Nanoarchaeia archaeon]|nr:signal peptidase I [Candidatus Nanoarchaeia archaeon]